MMKFLLIGVVWISTLVATIIILLPLIYLCGSLLHEITGFGIRHEPLLPAGQVLSASYLLALPLFFLSSIIIIIVRKQNNLQIVQNFIVKYLQATAIIVLIAIGIQFVHFSFFKPEEFDSPDFSLVLASIFLIVAPPLILAYILQRVFQRYTSY